MTKIVFVNGPPGSGKDEVARILCEHDPMFTHMKFAAPLKMGLATLLGLTWEEYEHYFESPAKEERGGPFDCYPPRQCLIELSESYMKEMFGADIFGRVAANIAETLGTNIVFSDSGFTLEAIPVVGLFGAENCKVIRLAREGCSFKADSRGYLDPYSLPGVKFKFIRNNGTLDELKDAVIDYVYGES